MTDKRDPVSSGNRGASGQNSPKGTNRTQGKKQGPKVGIRKFTIVEIIKEVVTKGLVTIPLQHPRHYKTTKSPLNPARLLACPRHQIVSSRHRLVTQIILLPEMCPGQGARGVQIEPERTSYRMLPG